MTIGIYLIRLIVSFFFGASVLCLILERHFANSDEWFVENDSLRIIMLIVTLIILMTSSICLWMIK